MLQPRLELGRLFKINALLVFLRAKQGKHSNYSSSEGTFPTNAHGLHGTQWIQLMDAQSLPRAHLGSAITAFAECR